MNYLIYSCIIIYGLFYHISSSEFWPITISKTWLNSINFEYSLLQKPLFGFFLSLFHLLPLDDLFHIYLVKFVFSFIGLLGLLFFIKFLIEISDIKSINQHTKISEGILLILLLGLSPVLLHNFFRIRTDQITFLFFSLVLLFNHRKQFFKSVFFLGLIPLISIKSYIFLIPVFFIVLPNYKIYFNRLKIVHKYYLFFAFIGVLIWVMSLNISALTYLADTFKTMDFPNKYLKKYLFLEIMPIFASLFSVIYIFLKKDTALKPYAIASIITFMLILLIPQSYPFYIASLAPIFYIPLFILLLKTVKLDTRKKIFLLGAQILTVVFISLYFKYDFYHSLNIQMDYIKKAGKIISKNNLSYLDGTGILPRQNFIPCFISPDDENANNACLNNIKTNNADVVIVTHRLSFLGTDLFVELEKNYIQLRPSFWIKNAYKSPYLESKIDLLNTMPAFLTFGFE